MFKESKTLEDISFAEGGIKVLDVLLEVFASKKKKDTYLNKITGEMKKAQAKEGEFKTIKPPVDRPRKTSKSDTKK